MSGRNKTMTEMARHIVGANNQSLHHFLTQAPWDPDELNRRRVELALFEKEDFERVTVKRADGTEDVRYVVGMEIKVKGLGKGKRRLVIVASDLDRLDPDHVEFLLTDTRLSNADVARAYALRNWVEVFYGDGKGELGLAKAQVRYEDGYARHWALVFLAHTLVMYHRMKGSFAGLVEKRGSPVSARECA